MSENFLEGFFSLVVKAWLQATLQPNKLDELASALENSGVPTYLGGMARGLLGAESGVQCRHARGKALKEADLVILGGVPADFRLNYGRRWAFIYFSDFLIILIIF